MAVQKRSVSLDPKAAEFLARRAERLNKSTSAVLNELVAEAARLEALEELGDGVDIPEREVERWLKKLGAA